MHFASMTLGLFDWLIEWLTEFLVWLIGLLIDLLLIVFADLFYAVGKCFLQIVDFIQLMFRRLSGLEVFYMEGNAVDSDPLLALMSNDMVMQVLIALSFVAVLMLILITIIQVIKVEFNSDGKNSKTTIIGQSLRALLMFAVVPICTVGGVIACNALLRVIDRATALGSSSTTMGAQIMASSVADANYLRLGSDYEEEADEIPWSKIGVSSPNLDTAANKEKAAKLMDDAFRNNDVSGYSKTNPPYANTDTVKEFYSTRKINYVILIGGALLAAYTMLMAAFGMVMRLYKGVILFMISPPLVALMPLDGGSAFKSWRTKFLGQVLAAYGTIVSLNLLFIVMPVVNNINLFADGERGLEGDTVIKLNNFCHVLFTLTALFTLKDIAGMISNLIGAEDAAASGGQVAGKVMGAAMKMGSVVGGVGGLALKGVGGVLGAAAKKNPNSKFLNAAARTVGGAGNKLVQKGKGTLGAAINKGIGAATGGAYKTTFSEETDYAKAEETRQKKKDERDARIKSGEAGLGDYVSKGTSVASKATGDFVGKYVVGGAAGLVGGTVTAIGGKGFKKGFNATSEVVGGVVSESGSGGVGAANAALETRAINTAETETAKTETKNAATVASVSTDLTQLGLDIAAGMDQTQVLNKFDEMIEKLQGIQNLTKNQKALLTNLQTQKQQIADSDGTTSTMGRIATSGATITTATIGKINDDATMRTNITSSNAINIEQIMKVSDDPTKLRAAVIEAMKADTSLGNHAVTAEVEKLENALKRYMSDIQAEIEKNNPKK